MKEYWTTEEKRNLGIIVLNDYQRTYILHFQ